MIHPCLINVNIKLCCNSHVTRHGTDFGSSAVIYVNDVLVFVLLFVPIRLLFVPMIDTSSLFLPITGCFGCLPKWLLTLLVNLYNTIMFGLNTNFTHAGPQFQFHLQPYGGKVSDEKDQDYNYNSILHCHWALKHSTSNTIREQ